MYKVKKIGKKYVGIAQTGTGYNVSTWSVKGNKVYSHKSQNTKTLADANKKFNIQKKQLIPKTTKKKSTTKRYSGFNMNSFFR